MNVKSVLSAFIIGECLVSCQPQQEANTTAVQEVTPCPEVEAPQETRRYCMALDLKEDEALIAEYEEYHKAVWPEILNGIKEVGILDMEIYRIGTRMFMIMEVPQDFDFDGQMAKLGTLPRQSEWEELMWKYQQALPYTKEGEKWMMMDKIFKLD